MKNVSKSFYLKLCDIVNIIQALGDQVEEILYHSTSSDKDLHK